MLLPIFPLVITCFKSLIFDYDSPPAFHEVFYIRYHLDEASSMSMVDWFGWILAGLLIVPFLALTIEIVAALFPARRTHRSLLRPRLTVLIPAHNEETGIAHTISAIIPQLTAHDRLVVIADNCTDHTEQVARSAGAETIVRTDANHTGKGYALDFGLKHLASNEPEVVVIIDADTIVQPNALENLGGAVAARGCPIQGVNLLIAPDDAKTTTRISAFAFFFKNYIRPRGLDRLGLPCLLYGTGMALPYDLIARANLAHGDITEDIRLGMDMALADKPPRFCLDAEVRGELPRQKVAATSQRRRWEHGHIRASLGYVPRLLWVGMSQRRLSLITLAIHIGIPPLSLLFIIGLTVTGMLVLINQTTPALVTACGLMVTLIAAFIAWARFGRGILPPRDLVLLPHYALKKVPLYVSFLFRPQREWIRTQRPATDGNPPSA